MFLNLCGKYESEEAVDKNTRNYATKIFTEADINGDKQLSMEEIWVLAQKIDGQITKEDLTKIKYYLDVDDDLHLDPNEFLPCIDLIRKNKDAREAATK
ncbi:hypothetical protein BG000_000676 [Podila horticola]|nr:hypothetical protein BG000_000676 [Podila horticola]